MGILKQLIVNKEKYDLTIQDIESIMVDFIMAGVDTVSLFFWLSIYILWICFKIKTALTLQYIVSELGRNQNIQQKLYDEICKYIKPGEELNIENVYKIPYLKMILKEALRFHNIVPAMSRVLKEDLILDGYRLPKGV